MQFLTVGDEGEKQDTVEVLRKVLAQPQDPAYKLDPKLSDAENVRRVANELCHEINDYVLTAAKAAEKLQSKAREFFRSLATIGNYELKEVTLVGMIERIGEVIRLMMFAQEEYETKKIKYANHELEEAPQDPFAEQLDDLTLESEFAARVFPKGALQTFKERHGTLGVNLIDWMLKTADLVAAGAFAFLDENVRKNINKKVGRHTANACEIVLAAFVDETFTNQARGQRCSRSEAPVIG